MRSLLFKMCVALPLVMGGVALSFANGPYPEPTVASWKQIGKLPGVIAHAAAHDNGFVAITKDAQVLLLDTSLNVKELGNFGLAYIHRIDAQGTTAALACQNRVYFVDLKTGKISGTFLWDHTIHEMGFVAEGKIYLRHAEKVAMLDTQSSTIAWSLELPARDTADHKSKFFNPNVSVVDKAGKSLYVTFVDEDGKPGLAIIDLEMGEVAHTIQPDNFKLRHNVWGGSMVLAGDRVYLTTYTSSCGFMLDVFGSIDLKTGEYVSMRDPEWDWAAKLVMGPRDTWMLVPMSGAGVTPAIYFNAAWQAIASTSGITSWSFVATFGDGLLAQKNNELWLVNFTF